MNYFTEKWAKGELSDKNYLKVIDSYWNNLEKNINQLPGQAYLFAKNIDLHDGLIKQIKYEDNSDIELIITCGDIQEGYSEISIKYTSSTIIPDTFREVSGEIKQHRFEIMSDEIDISDNLFVHRFLLFPFREFEIYYSGFNYKKIGVKDR